MPSNNSSPDSSIGGSSKPTDMTSPVTGEPLPDESSHFSQSSATNSGITAPVDVAAHRRRRMDRQRRALRSDATQLGKHWIRTNHRADQQLLSSHGSSSRSSNASTSRSSSVSRVATATGATNHSNSRLVYSTSNSSNSDDDVFQVEGETGSHKVSSDSTDSNTEEASEQVVAVQQTDYTDQEEQNEQLEMSVINLQPNAEQEQIAAVDFLNLDEPGNRGIGADKTALANTIERAVMDFCSSRTVETMRRMFVGATSDEALMGEASRQGDKAVLAPHPVTGELVKEGIVIGSMDVFAPRVHREFRLVMKDNLVEAFIKDAGMFRSICYRTKCQLEVTRRLLNKKLCTGGRWVKYLIIRITGPSLRAITCCDQLLQKAMPTFKHRIEYNKAAYCRVFFREDIPDNTLLYHCYQRTGGSSNRYGALRLETPYRVTAERTLGNCPWKSGALKVGKLSFNGSGGHLTMRQVYPGYGYTTTSPVEPACQGEAAVRRIEGMHGHCIARRQQLLQDKRAMTIPVCR